jgi:hypothetical protein
VLTAQPPGNLNRDKPIAAREDSENITLVRRQLHQ